jgi:hypothetical protein
MEEIFNKLFKVGLTPNLFYVLYSYKTKVTCDSSINTSLESSRLESDGWISMGQLTTKSVNLIQDIDSYFKLSKKKTSTQVMGDDFLTKIDEYLEIFPKFKLPSGKYARSDKKNLENNFRWFFETNSYDWDTVINATKMYVDEFERQGYKYMRTSQYFIRKLNPAEKTFESELANYCEVYMNGDTDYNDDGYFKEKVV